MTSTNGLARNRLEDNLLATRQVIAPPVARPRISNAIDGEPQPLPEIAREIRRACHDWPKVVGGTMYVQSTESLRPLTKASQLFGYLADLVGIEWKQGAKFVTKEEFFQQFPQYLECFNALELYPHNQPLPGSFYYHRELPPVQPGLLDQLLGQFNPASTIDARLLRAYVCTPFWAGSPGSRPIFVFTNSTSRTGAVRDTGRGIGKSAIVAEISELCGGFIDVGSDTDIGKLETRLLSPGAIGKRLLRVDNVKTERLSNAGLERLTTSPVISGHGMYQGERCRPNHLTYALTMNGVSVSEDLATRSVVIELVRPPAYDPFWLRNVRDFIDTHR